MMEPLDGRAVEGSAVEGSAPDGNAPDGNAPDGNAPDGNALDGNAIGGLLLEVFGVEMTTASSVCGSCGATRQVAELAVYRHQLGSVVRCRGCDSVLMVFVQIRGITCVDLQGLASLG